MNSKKNLYAIIVIIVLVLIAIISYMQSKNNSATQSDTSTTTMSATTTDVMSTTSTSNATHTPPVPVPVDTRTALTVFHSAYADDVQGYNVNTYSGTIDAPTPCHILKSFASLIESKKEIVLTFSLTGPAKPNDVCAQAITPKPFMLSISAPTDATLTATLNGSPLPIKVVEK